jgi:hypothetical protein
VLKTAFVCSVTSRNMTETRRLSAELGAPIFRLEYSHASLSDGDTF